MNKQLLLFPESELQKLERRLNQLEEKYDNLRKKMFAVNGKTYKMAEINHDRLEVIERNICKDSLLIKNAEKEQNDVYHD